MTVPAPLAVVFTAANPIELTILEAQQDRLERLQAVYLAPAQRHTCRRCGRPLTDPASIRAAIGPTCAARERASGQTHFHDYEGRIHDA